MDDYLKRILQARVYDVAVETPVEEAPRLSARLGASVLLKREDLQAVFSFKLRGAYNKMVSLPRDSLRAGVVCSSAGNHAQGVALAAQRLACSATIVMPITTPSIKVDAVRRLGGEVVLHGESYDEAYGRALELSQKHGFTFIHPFDDPEVIAGQGTIGMELLHQLSELPDAVFLPVGGGGLIAGVSAYLKALRPEIRVIGVEPADAASMTAALEAGAPVELDRVGAFADGVAVRRVGDETFRICAQTIDEMILVSNDQICAAIRDVFEDTRSIAEPAGALAVAGLVAYRERGAGEGERLVAVVCGANVNFDRLRHIAERADFGAHREALLAVEIPERPGSFRRFCETIGRRHVTEFNYRFGDRERARIFVGVELTRGDTEKAELIAHLEEAGYSTLDLSDNEMARLHLRHMVGGYGHRVENEVVYRFWFPERRGALLGFLDAVGSRWNISLFHYRNHGSDFGRVLAGIQVPPSQREELGAHLEALGYPCEDESENPAYRLFLKG